MPQAQEPVIRKLRVSGMGNEMDREERRFRGILMGRLYGGEDETPDHQRVCWDIYNGNADQIVGLKNLYKKIVEADAFLFMPRATLQDMVAASSVIVGYQTGDRDLDGKPTVLLNSDGSWTDFIELIQHLRRMKTVSQDPHALITVLDDAVPKQIAIALQDRSMRTERIKTRPELASGGFFQPNPHMPKVKRPDYNVCVFCSASTKNEGYIQMGTDMGTMLAHRGWGTVSGAGITGIMGSVVKGAYLAGGWTGGSNIPHIIELEGVPDTLHAFWARNDIYSRMKIMIRKSDSFVILPGGMGSVQEALSVLQLKKLEDPSMHKKPIILVNEQSTGVGFWDPLISLCNKLGVGDLMQVVTDINQAVELLEKHERSL